MKGLGALMALAYIIPVEGRILWERRMMLDDGKHALNMSELESQEGLR